MNNKKVFTVKVEGKDLELCIRKPTAEIRSRSQLHYNKAIREAIDNGSILQRQLDDYAEKLGLWNAERRDKVASLQEQLRDLERKLKSGANAFETKDAAKTAAFEMRRLRWELISVQQSKNDLYPYTAESYAEDARTKYLVSMCTLDNNSGKPLWKSYDEYLSQSESETGLAAMANYIELMYDGINSIEQDWPESKWLLKYGYVDDKIRPINSEGQLIELDSGKLINEQGQYITKDNRLCDRDGNLLSDDGSYLMDYKEFSE